MLKEIIGQNPRKQPIPGALPVAAPTLAEAVAEVEETQLKIDEARFKISDVEQFTFDQGLTGPEAEAVEIICNHESASDLDIAINKLQRVKFLKYRDL